MFLFLFIFCKGFDLGNETVPSSLLPCVTFMSLKVRVIKTSKFLFLSVVSFLMAIKLGRTGRGNLKIPDVLIVFL